ncbi:MAG: hypothetical protein HOO06_09395 [Bdellovibrionaceae bacterium]|jgi:hypothetical protein|nr:hypothetical protein [Pseudobdellovibrionaceae bacterium]
MQNFIKVTLVTYLLSSTPTLGQISHTELNEVFHATSMAYEKKLEETQSALLFNPEDRGLSPWDFSNYLRASYVKIDPTQLENNESNSKWNSSVKTIHIVNVYGGYANLKGITKDGIALVICHELGHAFAKQNFKWDESPMEGEADYYTTSKCLKKVFQFLPKSNHSPKLPSGELDICLSSILDSKLCERVLFAIKHSFMLSLHKETQIQTNLLTPDKTTSLEINRDLRFYPNPQCRIDTLVAGLLLNPRPSCWFQ